MDPTISSTGSLHFNGVADHILYGARELSLNGHAVFLLLPTGKVTAIILDDELDVTSGDGHLLPESERETLRNLNGIERGALQELIACHPEAQAVIEGAILPDTSHLAVVPSG